MAEDLSFRAEAAAEYDRAFAQTVKLPRWRRAASYSDQFVTRCCCFGMWWRRSALTLKGMAHIGS